MWIRVEEWINVNDITASDSKLSILSSQEPNLWQIYRDMGKGNEDDSSCLGSVSKGVSKTGLVASGFFFCLFVFSYCKGQVTLVWTHMAVSFHTEGHFIQKHSWRHMTVKDSMSQLKKPSKPSFLTLFFLFLTKTHTFQYSYRVHYKL